MHDAKQTLASFRVATRSLFAVSVLAHVGCAQGAIGAMGDDSPPNPTTDDGGIHHADTDAGIDDRDMFTDNPTIPTIFPKTASASRATRSGPSARTSMNGVTAAPNQRTSAGRA